VRVLYFTAVPLIDESNGGNICCRNHVRRLAEDPGIELYVIAAAERHQASATSAFLSGHAVEHHVLPFRDAHVRPQAHGLRPMASFLATAAFQYPWELRALNQQHLQEGIVWAVAAYGIDTVVIDYTPSAYFLQLPLRNVRTCLIKLNREDDFYAEQIRLAKTHHGRLTASISYARLRRAERAIEASVDKVVAIGEPDLPRSRTRSPAVVVTPFLNPRKPRWSYRSSKTAFFVGNVGHFPNWQAVEWIATQLAPRVAAEGPDLRFAVVGAGAEDVPAAWRQPTVSYLGLADRDGVQSLFGGAADLMLCPLENDFGVKFKALEALAHGTPLLASRQTLQGLPQLDDEPALDLARPDEAAAVVCTLLSRRAVLEELAVRQGEAQATFIASQKGVWSRVLGSIPAPAPHRSGGLFG
jgi:glycosyltransferase involved in cell wall biosynthesis